MEAARREIKCANKKSILAIIGGSGPEAGINVMERVLSIHRKNIGGLYESDKDAVSIIMVQDPGMGGPHGTWDMMDPNSAASLLLWKNMTSIIKKLNAIHVDYFCIACNTLHYLEPRLREWMTMERIKPTFISIVEVTKSVIMKHCRKNILEQDNGLITDDCNHEGGFDLNKIKSKRVAILGSWLTTDMEGLSPYASLFQANEDVLDCIVLQEQYRHALQHFIDETKTKGVTPDIQIQFLKFLNQQFLDDENKMTDYIVLCCTELPMLLKDDCRRVLEDAGIVVVDPNAALAEEMLRHGGYMT